MGLAVRTFLLSSAGDDDEPLLTEKLRRQCKSQTLVGTCICDTQSGCRLVAHMSRSQQDDEAGRPVTRNQSERGCAREGCKLAPNASAAAVASMQR